MRGQQGNGEGIAWRIDWEGGWKKMWGRTEEILRRDGVEGREFLENGGAGEMGRGCLEESVEGEREIGKRGG